MAKTLVLAMDTSPLTKLFLERKSPMDTQHRHRDTRALHPYHTFHDVLLDNEFTKSRLREKQG
jgi:hypothetical protein